MRKVTFNLPEYKQIEVNGAIFDILRADVDILQKAEALRDQYSSITEASDFNDIMSAVREVVGYVDEILGEGATMKITQGRPIGLVESFQLVSLICEAVVEEYKQSLHEKYD